MNKLPYIDNMKLYAGDYYAITKLACCGDITGYTILFEARLSKESRHDILSKPCGIVDGPRGEYILILESHETDGLSTQGECYYDIVLIDPNGIPHTDRKGTFELVGRVTKV